MEGPTVDVQIVDVFTSAPFSGNPAGVVLEADHLDGGQMQRIASEVHASATAFVTEQKSATFSIRYFTPTTEVGFCGHASIAAVSSLVRQGRIQVGDEPARVTLSVRAGEMPVEVRPHPVHGVEVALGGAPPEFRPFRYSMELLTGILGLDTYQVPQHWPLALASCGSWSLVVPVTTKDAVDAARPDFESLAQLGEKMGAGVTMLYTWQGPVDLYCRGFAPGVGVPEDPVTGTGLLAVAALVVKEGAVQTTAPLTCMTAEQGTFMGRKGRASLEVVHRENRVERVRVVGTAAQSFEGKIRIPA